MDADAIFELCAQSKLGAIDQILSDDLVAEADRLCSQGGPELPQLLRARGLLHWCRFLALGEEEGVVDLAKALHDLLPFAADSPETVPYALRNQEVQAAPNPLVIVAGHPAVAGERAVALLNYARKHDGVLDVLRRAISETDRALDSDDPYVRSAAAMTRVSARARIYDLWHDSIGNLYSWRADSLLAVDIVEPSHEMRLEALVQLAFSTTSLALRLRSEELLDAAVLALDDAIAVQEVDDRPGTDDLRTLLVGERARVTTAREALAAEDAPHELMRVTNLANVYLQLHRTEPNGDHGQLSVDYFRRALALAGDDEQARGLALTNLGAALRECMPSDRNALQESRGLLEEATAMLSGAGGEATNYDPDVGVSTDSIHLRIGALANLALTLSSLDPRDPDARSTIDTAMALIHRDAKFRKEYLVDVVRINCRAAEAHGDPSYLDRVLDAQPTADSGFPPLDAAIAEARRVRATMRRDVAELSQSIQGLYRCLRVEGLERRDQILHSLCEGLATHFDLTGDVVSLEQIVMEAGPSLAAAEPTNPGALPLRMVFATAAIQLSEYVDNPQGLLIRAAQELDVSVRHSKADTGQADYRLRRAEALIAFYYRTRDENAFSLAAQEIWALASEESAGRSARATALANLARAYVVRGEDGAGAQNARDAMSTAVRLVSDDGEARPAIYLNAALLTAAYGEMQEAISLARAVSADHGSATSLRLRAACYLGEWQGQQGEWQQSLTAYRDALHLLSRAPAFGLLDMNGFVQELGSTSLSAGLVTASVMSGEEPIDSLIALEAARAQAIRNLLDLHGNIGVTGSDQPGQLEELGELRAELLTPGLDLTASVLTASGTHARALQAAAGNRLREASLRWDALRSRLGLDKPLELTESELADLTAAGPVVVVCAGAFTGWAFIVQGRTVERLDLADLTASRVEKWVQTVKAAAGIGFEPGTASAGDRMLSNVLRELWEALGLPVVEALRLYAAVNEPLPRLWWIPTGAINLLPLHASSPGDEARGMLDCAVSSYSASIGMLQESQRLSREPSTVFDQALVGLSWTPGAPNLPFVADELAQLELVLGVTAIRDGRATRESVAEAIRRCRLFHFAGHGVSNARSPWDSRLLLSDDDLSVRDIVRLPRSAGYRCAFLSACSTAAVEAGFADECVHIGSAFQVAGFCEVVGTLWALNDASAADIARRVYQSGVGDGLARSLHEAVVSARGTAPDRPLAWASYLHFGA